MTTNFAQCGKHHDGPSSYAPLGRHGTCSTMASLHIALAPPRSPSPWPTVVCVLTIPLTLPLNHLNLIQAIIMPEYLANDAVKYFKEMPIATQWPSLLVGPAGIHTTPVLHIKPSHHLVYLVPSASRGVVLILLGSWPLLGCNLFCFPIVSQLTCDTSSTYMCYMCYV